MSNSETTEVHELVGLPDGFVDDNAETIVYEKDENGNVTGWHKEPANG